MNQARQIMPGVIQVTGHGRMATKADNDAWYRELMVAIGLNQDGTKKEVEVV